VGLFLNEYIRRNGITDYVFVVVSGACRRVAQMFGIKNIVVVGPRRADAIFRANYAFRAGWPVVVLNDGWGAEPTQWIRGYKGLSFERMFRYFVFGFDDSVRYELPPVRDNSAEIDAIFAEHNLIKGATVVLSPYSNTLFELPEAFWLRIAAYCQSAGYSVCTNCAGASEKPVAGTQAVFFPLDKAVDFMNAAGYFVGIRSGLCDVISTSACKKILLYEKDSFFYKCSPYAYFSLNGMGLCADALELEYRADIKEQVLKQIFRGIDNDI
jgi:hypothetical protein